jgi:mRNA interferase RelE/StbE
VTCSPTKPLTSAAPACFRRLSGEGSKIPRPHSLIHAYEFITGPPLAQPHRIGKQLLPPLDDRFSARRGTYRVIYRIDDEARVVTVVDIGHRRDVYRT